MYQISFGGFLKNFTSLIQSKYELNDEVVGVMYLNFEIIELFVMLPKTYINRYRS